MPFQIHPSTAPTRRLARAACANDVPGMEKALAEGADPNACLTAGAVQSLLSRTVALGNAEATDRLLDAGADPATELSSFSAEGSRFTAAPTAFTLLAYKGDAQRVRAWLDRFPGLHTQARLLPALCITPRHADETFTLLMKAAHALPDGWHPCASMGTALENMARTGWLDRMKDLAYLDPTVSGSPSLTRALLVAVQANHGPTVRWLLRMGADPLLPETPSNDSTPKRTAREVAVRHNRPAMLEILDNAEGAPGFKEEEWVKSVGDAVKSQSRSVFQALWKTPHLTPDAKRLLLDGAPVESNLLKTIVTPTANTQRVQRMPVSLVEVAAEGNDRERIPGWLSLLIKNGLASPEDMGRAAHTVLHLARGKDSPGWAEKALERMETANVDWNQRGRYATHLALTAKEEGLMHENLKACVSRLLAQRSAKELAISLTTPSSQSRHAARRRL